MSRRHISDTSMALSAIMDERLRQVHELGHSPEHDQEHHGAGCLARAAAARLAVVASSALAPSDPQLAQELRNMAILLDPWSSAAAFLRTSPLRLLAEAGALTAAELERQERAGSAL